MLSCAINAKKSRYVILTDIPGAIINADMEGTVNMILEGEIAKLIVKLEPETYNKYICYNHK